MQHNSFESLSHNIISVTGKALPLLINMAPRRNRSSRRTKMTIFVQYLDPIFGFGRREIESLFSDFGKFDLIDLHNGLTSYAVIEFDNYLSGKSALQFYNGPNYYGQKLIVEKIKNQNNYGYSRYVKDVVPSKLHLECHYPSTSSQVSHASQTVDRKPRVFSWKRLLLWTTLVIAGSLVLEYLIASQIKW